MFDFEAPPTRAARAEVPSAAIDRTLTAQFAVAWAGEGGEEPRLRWWRSDIVSRYGGEDLFRRLLPNTWEWALLQAVREAARRKDAEMRSRAHDPDTLVTLFRFGAELDERIDERLQDLKASGQAPHDALPGLRDVVTSAWSRDRFLEWVQSHGPVETSTAPTGRRIAGSPSGDLDALVRSLVAGLAPLTDAYPLPHVRKA
jgi:AcrR family transcriptional regulator